ncbi:MAG: AMP-binding protein [Myxococcota bacterium]
MSLALRHPPRAASVPARSDVISCVRFHRDAAPDATACALFAEGRWRTLSRARLWERIDYWASVFTVALPAPTVVLFCKRLDIDLVAAYLGAMAAGHIPAAVAHPSAKMSPGEFRRRIRHIQATVPVGAVFVDRDTASTFDGDLKTFTPSTCVPGAFRVRPQSTSADALIQFSSGSTGHQKGVVLRHDAIVAHMRAYAERLELRSDDAIMTWLPLYHDMGLIAAYLMPLMCGIPFFQMDPFTWVAQPDRWLAAIESLGATIAFQPNFAYHLLARRAPRGGEVRLGGVRQWVNCSEPARGQSHERFLRAFPTVRRDAMHVCYALAENTFAVSHTRPDEVGRDQGGVLSCGSPLRGVDLKVVDAVGRDVVSPTEGEIIVDSPFRFERFVDGRRPYAGYATGDLGFIGPEGDVYVSGRKNDLIICHGKNVHPQDVEFVASDVTGVHPGRVVAFGIDDPLTGSEELFVIVERERGVEPGPLRLAVQRAVAGEVGLVPRRVEVAELKTLVKTSSGKLSRARNRDLYRAQSLPLVGDR